MANFTITDWLPTTPKEVKAREWDELDIILFSGDAYIDHPSFGIPLIGRILEDAGFRVAIVPQPNWQDDLRDFTKLGKPRLFFGVSAGAMDSMVNHYTARKRRRSTDAYTPGNVSGFRPDYPSLVYTAALKKCFPDVPVILGGVEASLRRLTHYDYWKDQLQKSILLTAGADMIVYGMGEASILQIARLVDRGVPFRQITNLKQTVVSCDKSEQDTVIGKQRYAALHSHADCLADKRKYAENFATIEIASNMTHPDVIVQECDDRLVVVNPPYPVIAEKQLDRIYDLPYTRLPHPRYRNKPPIPAYEMIRHSINTHRGCFGGCSFCTISAHQGKFISSRSEASIIREVEKVTEMEDFKGYISDMGGPSANMYRMKGRNQKVCDVCQRPSCLHPSICRNLDTDHAPLTALYKKAAAVPGVKKVTIGSGIRYDFLDQEEEKNHFREYFSDIVRHHVSGRLKVAPEHTDPKILERMRKPDFSLFRELTQEFNRINREAGMQQQIIPYFISSHPECTPEEMAELAVMTRDQGFRLEQVQDFTPTPMTLATVMYHSGYDPYTLEKVVTAKSVREKARQVIFFFWYKKEYRKQIRDELVQMGREDLIPKLLERQ